MQVATQDHTSTLLRYSNQGPNKWKAGQKETIMKQACECEQTTFYMCAWNAKPHLEACRPAETNLLCAQQPAKPHTSRLMLQSSVYVLQVYVLQVLQVCYRCVTGVLQVYYMPFVPDDVFCLPLSPQ